MALPWKCKSYLPTSRAISWTNHKKGSFLMRSSVLFWNCQISQRATVPGQYFLVFLTFQAWRNSFWGALPPTVGWSFLLPGSSLPKADGLASVSHLGQLLGRQWWWRSSHILQPSCFLHPPLCLLHLPLSPPISQVRASCWGWVMNWRGGPPSFLCQSSPLPLWSGEPTSPHLFHPFWVSPWFLPYCKTIGKCQPMEKQHYFVLTRFCLAAIFGIYE